MYVFIQLILDLLEDDVDFQGAVYADPMLHMAFIEGNNEAAMVALFDLYTVYPSITAKSCVFSSTRFQTLVEVELGADNLNAWARCGKGTFQEMAFNAGLQWLVSNA